MATLVATNGERHCAIVSGHQVLSKLLRVNCESREAALEFYRVHIPCRFQGLGDVKETTTTPGTLYFNPEYDFLKIRPQYHVKDTWIDFIYHLKNTYDPHRIGLLNLAASVNDLNGNDMHLVEPSDVDPVARKAFTDTLSQLHEVFFLSKTGQGRQILGWQSGITSDTILNRSFPIVPKTPTFERLGRDPRPIAEDLKNVVVHERGAVITFWRELLIKWAVSAPQIEYHFYLTFEPLHVGKGIHDHKSASAWLRKEDDVWRGVESSRDQDPKEDTTSDFYRAWRKLNIKRPVGAKHEKYKNENLETAVKPAFGFWLFPLAALDRDDESKMLDMSEFWPELALSDLP
ncbi:hypothetical protein LOCC1_G006808 [Lachnellula occidentalis]|uniref:2EXR domain-containing protein n=1 Tax=Lachnellula occidentalis TaxID=215460 RepID=A0A8H8UGJ2_9HELO|nr:hypothetical protein LOCC1_G006808 [Lachnellula occidentalis]